MIEFKLPDMSCGHCVSSVTEAVKQVDPAAKVDVDLASKRVTVETTQPREPIAEALSEAGYPPA
ncbi:MAG TPA: heavy-metal-associated domain-containing protein [Ramlibacter sp.]|nr:heavy-metal-associated domain-containing protein [Ramlibacter sp.]